MVPVFIVFILTLLLPILTTANTIDIQHNGQFSPEPSTLWYTTATFTRLLSWTRKHLDPQNGGIIISTGKRSIYPEVTGYFIPTLLEVGEYDLAHNFGRALIKAQHNDGSFGLGGRGFVFDTAMVVRGLTALAERQPRSNDNAPLNVVPTLRAACQWLTQEIDDRTKRWVVPGGNIWGLPSGRGRVSEGIHLLGILPLRKCGALLKNQEYTRISEEMESKLINDLDPLELYDFTRPHHLTHFYAYIMEALQELGHNQLVRNGMAMVASFQKENGAVPGYYNVEWVCTTGLSQLALVWFRMGDPESLVRGHKALDFVFNELQNKQTFGFTGSQGPEATYFPFQEISWAVKYAIDATLAIPVAHFNHVVIDTFPTHLHLQDDRLQIILENINSIRTPTTEGGEIVAAEMGDGGMDTGGGVGGGDTPSLPVLPVLPVLDVLDVGCGKGRFVSALHQLHPVDLRITGTDLSAGMLRIAGNTIPAASSVVSALHAAANQTVLPPTFIRSSATALPFPDNSFHVVYLVESMEHILFVNSTLQECHRVLKKNGSLIVVDKTTDDIHRRSSLWTLEQWETWYGIEEFEMLMHPVFGKKNVTSTRLTMDAGLFVAWVGIK